MLLRAFTEHQLRARSHTKLFAYIISNSYLFEIEILQFSFVNFLLLLKKNEALRGQVTHLNASSKWRVDSNPSGCEIKVSALSPNVVLQKNLHCNREPGKKRNENEDRGPVRHKMGSQNKGEMSPLESPWKWSGGDRQQMCVWPFLSFAPVLCHGLLPAAETKLVIIPALITVLAFKPWFECFCCFKHLPVPSQCYQR